MWRSVAPRNRRARIVLILFASAIRAEASPETRVPPLPPPVSRAVYRANWFDLLSALQENDARAAKTSLDAMMKAARAAGMRRLSSYSRAALHEARKAEKRKAPHAAVAYDVASTLDESNFDAAASRIGFLVRQRRLREAVSRAPAALATIFESAESRLAFFSSLALAIAITLAVTSVAIVLGLFLTHFRRLWHDIRETAGRPFGHRAGTPLALVLLALPAFFALGPMWLLLYWAVLAYAYSNKGERSLLASALLALGVVPLLVAAVARENLVRRSPLYLAAVDLEERREDSSVEEQLASMATASPDQPDVWFLLAMYAERGGDYPRALTRYGQAIAADPKDYRALVNRGNVRFLEGDFVGAIVDYEEAARRAPEAVEAFYNLSVARAEIYDFKGQERARARALQISRRDVDAWSSRPPLSRVVAATYRVSIARERLARWTGRKPNPGHAGKVGAAVPDLLRSAWCLAPWGALLFALVLRAVRTRRGVATECSRCGRPFCRSCKLYGGAATFCGRCVRLYARKEAVAEDVREADRRESKSRARRRRRVVRAVSLFAPGIHNIFVHRPSAAAATLLFFFFTLTLAVGGPWVFEVRPLAPFGAALPGRLAVAALALALWIAANARAWRQTRES